MGTGPRKHLPPRQIRRSGHTDAVIGNDSLWNDHLTRIHAKIVWGIKLAIGEFRSVPCLLLPGV